MQASWSKLKQQNGNSTAPSAAILAKTTTSPSDSPGSAALTGEFRIMLEQLHRYDRLTHFA
ncbi:MAG TPA: hypothetical protein DD423_00625 [Opitutae bacterium]|nr:hypothetical protein [Opitutae bacterium]